LRFFSFFTLHWVILWLGLAGFALWRLLPAMGPCANHYLIALGAWGLLNLIYLAVYFGKAWDHSGVTGFLAKWKASENRGS